MTRKVLILATFLGTTILGTVSAQTPASGMTTSTSQSTSLSPKDKWELGIHAGSAFSVGDLDTKYGYGFGGHLRHSLDHVFSLRGSAFYGGFKNEGKSNGGSADGRSSSTKWLAGNLEAVITLNNLRFNKPIRKINVYVFAGAGLNNFTTDFKGIKTFPPSISIKKEFDPVTGNGKVQSTNVQLDGGAGIAFRISPKMNFFIEHTANFGLGKGADYVDGDANNYDVHPTSYRDVVHYLHVGLNFNLGKSSLSEPLYWVNPMGQVMNDIAELKARPIYDPTDTDGDGIIDAIDQEKESPAGARVDTRGVTLDSDSDGVADFKDKEPYSPPGYKVDGMGIAQIPKEPKITEADVNRIVDGAIAKIPKPAPPGMVDWFLPMVHFDLDRYDIKKAEYENMYQVAQVLKQNPNLKIVVTGHTDRTSGNTYNNVLSYNRAKSAIEFLVGTHGISRDRLILNWGGEDKNLVPAAGQSYMNRRVEFRSAAAGDKEQGRPEGPKAGHGYKGNKDAGY